MAPFKAKWLPFFLNAVRHYHAGRLEEPQLAWAHTFAPGMSEAEAERMDPTRMLTLYLEAMAYDWPYRERRITGARQQSPDAVEVTYEAVVSGHGMTKVLPPSAPWCAERQPAGALIVPRGSSTPEGGSA